MTNESSKIVVGLRATADVALHYFQRGIAHSADAAKRLAGEATRAAVRIRIWKETGPGEMPVPRGGGTDDSAALDLASLSSHIELLAWHFADQERRLANFDEPAPPVDCAALEAELAAVRARVRMRRGQVAARAAEQTRSARHMEARARRLEERLDRLCHDRTRLRELDLAIASADAARIGSQVKLEEAAAQLAASERELSSYANESALLRERGVSVAAARELAAERLNRIRSKLAALEEDVAALYAHDLMSPGEAASRDAALRDLLSQLHAVADDCAAGVDGIQRPEDAARSAVPARAARALPQLDRDALRVPVERRLRMLEALAEIRVEETQAAPAAGADEPTRSRAAFARLSSTHIRLLLDEHERAWILDTLEAVGHEQGVRLSHGVDREPDALAGQLHGAVTAWRRCDERLDEAAARTRTAQLELASLRSAVTPAMARVDAEVREHGARMRERQGALRALARSRERAESTLRVTRQRQRALAKSVRRAREEMERTLARLDSATIAGIGRLGALERGIDTAAALIGALRASHEQIVQAMTAAEHELLELSREDQGVATTAAPPAVGVHEPSPAEEPWSRARMERDIAALADELERWKTRHAQLEQRVEAQAGLLASVEIVHRQDEALAEFRLELEHARSIAHASLQRALGAHSGEPRRPEPDTDDDETGPPSPSARSRTAR